jgi:outer membrane protein assembly factor BamB
MTPPTFSRRGVLTAASALGLDAVVGSGHRTQTPADEHPADNDSTTNTSPLSGQVIGPNGNPVPEARVYVYDSTQLELITVEYANDQGEFTIDIPPGQRYLIATHDDWFGQSPPYEHPADGSSIELTLDHQLLFGPQEVITDDGTTTLGLVSVWRLLSGEPPYTEQTFYIEVTNVAWGGGTPPWEIQANEADLSNGLFTFSFPESDITVNYGAQSPDIDYGTSVAVLGEGTPDTQDPTPVTQLHPFRGDTPNLPFHGIASHAVAMYRFLSQTNTADAETVTEGLGRTLSLVPGLGTVVTWVDNVDWAFGTVFGSAKQGSVGQTDFPPQDPNEMDTIVQGWRTATPPPLDEATVVLTVPLRFEIESEETTSILTQAEWKIERLVGEWAGSFGQEFTVGPQVEDVGTPQDTDQSATGSDWATYQFDASNTGYHPTAQGPSTIMEERWRASTADAVRTTPIVKDGQVYVGTGARSGGPKRSHGKLIALTADDGTKQWEYNPEYAVSSTPTVRNDTVYFGSNAGVLHALHPDDGSVRWAFELEDIHLGVTVSGAPTVVDGTVFFGSGHSGTAAYAVDAASGDQIWKLDTTGSVTTAPAVADGVVFVGDVKRAANIHAVHAQDKTEKWQVSLGGGGIRTAPVIADGRVLLSPVHSGQIHALDAATGEEQWQFDTGSSVRRPSAISVAHGHVYAGNQDGIIYAIDPQTGTEQWSFRTDGQIAGPVIGEDTLYAGSADGHIYVLDPGTGEERGRHSVGESVRSILITGNTAFIGTQEGTVARFDAT